MRALIVVFLCILPMLSLAHTQTQGVGIPTMGTCGTSPSVTGTDQGGKITVGSGVVTSCVLNFSQTYPNAPKCVATADATVALSAAPTTSVLTIGAVSTIGGGSVYYYCWLT